MPSAPPDPTSATASLRKAVLRAADEKTAAAARRCRATAFVKVLAAVTDQSCARVGGGGENDRVIDPLERWRQYGEKPDYAGLLTFGGLPYTQDPAELAGVDVAIVGAPTDDLVSDRPGARFAPRAIRGASCPPGPHLEAKVDATRVLRIVDF